MKCATVSRALIVRLFFASHGLISIYLLYLYTSRSAHWYLATALAGLFFECMVTLIRNHGHEWKWFCPSVFFYLLSVVPAIWFFEIELFIVRELANDRCLDDMIAQNKTVKNHTPQESKVIDCEYYKTMELKNNPFLSMESASVDFMEMERSARMSEQLLLLILILGRWFLPKGKLSHDQLSQLLLVYLGTAADIAEFFEAFKEKTVKSNYILCLFILGIWSWSLLQFAFVLTAARARKDQSGILSGRNQSNTSYGRNFVSFLSIQDYKSHQNINCYSRLCQMFSPDVYGIIISISLQDGPFLAFRLTLIFRFHVLSYTNMFFTAKNSLVILLLIYRLIVIWCEQRKRIQKQENENSNSKVVLRRLEYQDGISVFNNRESKPISFDYLDVAKAVTLSDINTYKCSDPRNLINRCTSYIDLETGTLVRNNNINQKSLTPSLNQHNVPVNTFDHSTSKESPTSSRKSLENKLYTEKPQSLTSILSSANESNLVKKLSNSSKIDEDIESICKEARTFLEKKNSKVPCPNNVGEHKT